LKQKYNINGSKIYILFLFDWNDSGSTGVSCVFSEFADPFIEQFAHRNPIQLHVFPEISAISEGR
jgi:hypothetical protein